MEVSNLVPSSSPLPAPWGLFEALNLLTFYVHILLVNVVLGGTLILFYTQAVRGDDHLPHHAAGVLRGKLTNFLALTITIGIAPLLFVQLVYGQFFYTSSVLMAIWWFLVIPLLIVAYYGLYIHKHAEEKQRVRGTVTAGLAALIFLYIAFIYVNNNTLMLHPESWVRYFEHRGGTLLNLGDPTLWPRYLHFLAASVAITGLAMALFWRFHRKRSSGEAAGKIKTGLLIFAVATVVQIVSGFWFLVALPKEIMMEFMGQDTLRTILLLLGILLAIGALVMGFLGKLWGTIAHVLATVAVMVVLRSLVRLSYLRPYFEPGKVEVHPQYGVLALFLVILVLGLAAVYVMVRWARDAETGRAAQ